MKRDKSPLERDGFFGHFFTEDSLIVIRLIMLALMVWGIVKFAPHLKTFVEFLGNLLKAFVTS